ncbi:ribosomal RNA small subunit methyltransferase A [candidate division KSB1 bacterium]|nr:ribosomal RNA small subunit methyltransferase A [candidate division KSB1 bacterium]
MAWIEPKKSLGQHFLVDKNIAGKIVASLDLSATDRVLEIGPGKGILTTYLVKQAGQVFSVEIDGRLVTFLHNIFGDWQNLSVIHEDFVRFDFAPLLGDGDLKVIGNIPYHLTSAILFKIFNGIKNWGKVKGKVHSLTIMVQREVAQRIVASPGCKDYGILSVFSRYYGDPEVLFVVLPGAFRPRPKVESAVVRVTFEGNKVRPRDFDLFNRIVRTGFGQRRKMLKNSLQSIIGDLDLKKIDFDFQLRPERLSVEDFVLLSDQIGAQLGNSSD